MSRVGKFLECILVVREDRALLLKAMEFLSGAMNNN